MIDGNPDHVRPLEGLFKYRVSHDLEVVSDCVSGLRRIYSRPPHAVLINALLFASEDYGFARALAEDAGHASIRVIVLVSGKLEEIRARAVEQFGASVLELPASADEVNESIDRAKGLKNRSQAPRAVQWGAAEPAPAEATSDEPPSVQRVAWQSFEAAEKTDAGKTVRPVDWSVDGGDPAAGPPPPASRKPSRKPRPRPRQMPQEEKQAPVPKRVPKEEAAAFKPAFPTGGEGFRPIAEAAEKVDPPEEEGPQPFRATGHEGMKDVDPRDVKNR